MALHRKADKEDQPKPAQDNPKKADNVATIEDTVSAEEKTPPIGPQKHPQDGETLPTQQSRNRKSPQEPRTITLDALMRAVHNCCDGKKIAKLLLQNKIDKSYEWQTAGSHFRTTATPPPSHQLDNAATAHRLPYPWAKLCSRTNRVRCALRTSNANKSPAEATGNTDKSS